MNHEEATRYLDDLGDTVPDRRPPMADLVASGKAAERRKSRKTLAFIAASVALILGGGAFAQQVVVGSDDSPDRENLAEIPQAPDGMRFTGMSGVVVAVPESWVVAEDGCARETGVVWRYPDVVEPGSPNCPEPPASGYWASLGVGDLNSVEGRHLSPEMTLDGEPAQGAAVREGSGSNDYQAPQYCAPLPGSTMESCSILFGVPSRGVFFTLILRDEHARSQLDAIRSSLQLLSDGVTTVPFVQRGTPLGEAEAMIEKARLSANTGSAPVSASVVSTDPAAGSVLRVGDVVNLSSEATACGTGGQASPGRCGKSADDSDQRALVGGTQPRWDPRRVDELPAADADAAQLPDVIEPPTSSTSLLDAPVDAAVLVVDMGDTAQLLTPQGEWRSVPLEGQYPRLELSPDGTRLLVWHDADGSADEVVVHDLATGASRRLAYPSELQPSDSSRWVWTDEQTLLLDEPGGGWIVDTATGEVARVPYPRGFAWTVDADGAVLETNDYDKPAELTDWRGGHDRRVSEAATGRLLSLQADADTVVGTSYDGRPFSVIVADRQTMTPQAVLPLVDRDANYSNGGLGVLALVDDGSVLLRVVVFGRTDGLRIVRWDPGSGDLSALTSVKTPIENAVTFASGLLRQSDP